MEESTEKYIIFSPPIKKELDNGKTTTYKLKFIDSFRFISFRFMSSSLSSLVDNLSQGLHNKKRRKCMSCYVYISIKDNKLICKCTDCNKNYKLHFVKDLINRFANTYEFCNGDINNFFLLLRKGIYPYEYMDSWKRFDETLLPNKDFYSSLNMEDITDADYRHVKNI